MERNLAWLLTESSSIPMASIKDPKRSAPLSRLCSASFRVPSLRLPLRFRKTSALDAFPGSMDRSVEPPSPKAST